jgi:hypothetical protein
MVLSRALSLAAVTLVVGCCAMGQVAAQENLDAGKSPSQIFSSTCTACHKSARGLLKTVAPGALQGFLRQHYTTSPEMAGVLASYLMSNGASDTRYGDKQKGTKGGKDGKEIRSEAKPTDKPEEAGAAQSEGEHPLHKRLARPTEAPEAAKPAAEGQVPGASEHEGRKSKRLSKRGKPGAGEEAPKADDKVETPKVETPKVETPGEPAREGATGGEPARSDTAKIEPAKPEAVRAEPVRSQPAISQPAASEPARPVESAKSVETAPVESPAQSANVNTSKPQVNEALPPSLRPDPVTPAAAAPATTPAEPSVTASAPPPPPAEPASPPVPPISR